MARRRNGGGALGAPASFVSRSRHRAADRHRWLPPLQPRLRARHRRPRPGSAAGRRPLRADPREGLPLLFLQRARRGPAPLGKQFAEVGTGRRLGGPAHTAPSRCALLFLRGQRLGAHPRAQPIPGRRQRGVAGGGREGCAGAERLATVRRNRRLAPVSPRGPPAAGPASRLDAPADGGGGARRAGRPRRSSLVRRHPHPGTSPGRTAHQKARQPLLFRRGEGNDAPGERPETAAPHRPPHPAGSRWASPALRRERHSRQGPPDQHRPAGVRPLAPGSLPGGGHGDRRRRGYPAGSADPSPEVAPTGGDSQAEGRREKPTWGSSWTLQQPRPGRPTSSGAWGVGS